MKPPIVDDVPAKAIKPTVRDEKGRIKKGSSGNYNGRPPKPVDALTSRGKHRMVIAEMERSIEINGETISAFQLVLRQTILAAAKGDRHARPLIFQLQQEAAEAVKLMNPIENLTLENNEKYVTTIGSEAHSGMYKYLNEQRKRAKKI